MLPKSCVLPQTSFLNYRNHKRFRKLDFDWIHKLSTDWVPVAHKTQRNQHRRPNATPRAAVSTTQVCAHVFVLEGCNSVKRRDGSAIYKTKKLSLPLLFTNWIATTLLANFLGLATLVVVVTLAWKRVPYIPHSGIKLDKDSCIISECLPPLGFGSEKHGSWRSQHCSGSQWRQSSHSPVCHHGLVRRTKSYRSDSWQSQCCCVDPTTC